MKWGDDFPHFITEFLFFMLTTEILTLIQN